MMKIGSLLTFCCLAFMACRDISSSRREMPEVNIPLKDLVSTTVSVKDTIFVGEKGIKAEVSLRNIYHEAIYVQFPRCFLQHFHAELFNDKGILISPQYQTNLNVCVDGYRKLLPNEEVQSEFSGNLENYYRLTESGTYHLNFNFYGSVLNKDSTTYLSGPGLAPPVSSQECRIVVKN